MHKKLKLESIAEAAGIAAKAAILSKLNKKKGRDYLVNAMGSIPGMPAKLSQILSTNSDINIPAGSVSVEAIPIEEIRKILEIEFPGLLDQIEEISTPGITASLGQVHRIRLKDGCDFAFKIQYPHVHSQVTFQLNGFFSLAGLSPAKKFGLDIDGYSDALTQTLNGELNYLHECKIQQRFSRYYASNSSIIIPRVISPSVAEHPPRDSTDTAPNSTMSYSDLKLESKKNILIQSWEPSITPQEFMKTAQIELRIDAAQTFAKMFLSGLFIHHEIHGDLHPMNYGFRPRTGDLVLYDFGASQVIQKRHAQIILQLVRSYSTKLPINPFDYLVAIGFDPEKLKHISMKLPTLCEKIFEPFIDTNFWQIHHWDIAKHFDRVLGSDKWWFRTAGPTWFFMLIKSTAGVIECLKTLNVNLKLKDILEEVTDGIVTDEIVPEISEAHMDSHLLSNACAKNLVIQVFDKGALKVDLSMPCRSVDNLEEIIPLSAKEYLFKNKICLNSLVQTVQHTGYLPQIILRTSGESKFSIELR